MRERPAAGLDRWLRMVRSQCAELIHLIEDSGCTRIAGLRWYGWTLREIAERPEILIGSRRSPMEPVASSHGFSRFIYRSPLTGEGARAAPTVWQLSVLSARPWHDDSVLARRLEENAAELIREFRRPGPRWSAHPDSAEIVRAGRWRAAFLSGPAQPHASGIAEDAAWRRIAGDDLCASFGFAAYFRTSAGTTFKRHTGSSNLRIRHHLCVDIWNDTDAYLDVATELRRWRIGKCLAFDDSFPHEVSHLSGPDRVVLNIDAWHPELTKAERTLLAHPSFAGLGKLPHWPSHPDSGQADLRFPAPIDSAAAC